MQTPDAGNMPFFRPVWEKRQFPTKNGVSCFPYLPCFAQKYSEKTSLAISSPMLFSDNHSKKIGNDLKTVKGMLLYFSTLRKER